MAFRISSYRELWDGKHGDIAVQTNVEDGRGGVDDYVMSKLEVNIIERKWGQGAKAIGGEVRLNSLDRALELKKRGYLVLPDPEDKAVQAAFKAGVVQDLRAAQPGGLPGHPLLRGGRREAAARRAPSMCSLRPARTARRSSPSP